MTAEDDALTIADQMKSNPAPWLDIQRKTFYDFEFEVEDVEEINDL